MPSAAKSPPEAVGLPPQQRGRARRAHLVQVATDLIDAAGSAGHRSVTLRDIARAADVPVPSIYHYFPDLDALVAAAADGFGNDLLATAQEALAGPAPTARAALNSLVSAYHGFFAAHPGLRDLWFDRRASARVVDIHHAYRARMAATLHDRMQGMAAGPVEPLASTMLFAIGSALWEMAFQFDPDGDPRVVAAIRDYAEKLVGDRSEPNPTRIPDGDRGARTASDTPLSGPSGPRPWEGPQPSQARGRRRRERILAAATTLIDARGPRGDDVGIRGIAQTADIAPASIYRYFDGVDSIVTAVAAAYMDELLEVADPRQRLTPHATWNEVVESVTAAHHDFLRSRPGLRELWFDRRASDQMPEIHRHYRRELATSYQETAQALFGAPGELLDHEIRVETSEALWDLAFTLDGEGHPDVIAEITGLTRADASR